MKVLLLFHADLYRYGQMLVAFTNDSTESQADDFFLSYKQNFIKYAD